MPRKNVELEIRIVRESFIHKHDKSNKLKSYSKVNVISKHILLKLSQFRESLKQKPNHSQKSPISVTI